jgi:hypothetical protein
MYPQQYPSAPAAPTAYNTDMQLNQQQYRESMGNYHTTSEERMASFQRVVDRYESELVHFETFVIELFS